MKHLPIYERFEKKLKPKYNVGDYVIANIDNMIDDWQKSYKYKIGKILHVSIMDIEYQYEPVYLIKLILNNNKTLKLNIRENFILRKATIKEIEKYKFDENIKKYNL